ncbi:MAG: cupin domain-containing protein [Polyangiales bacterium]
MKPLLDLSETYVHLEGDSAHAIPVTASFWSDLMSGSGDERIQAIGRGGWLVGTFDYDDSWDFHEMHPNGDELVILLDGEVDFELGETKVSARAGQTILVPRGVWHRAIVKKPGRAIHVTNGRGTEHRPL